MIIKKPVILFLEEDLFLTIININVNCDIPDEVEDEVILKYCGVISESKDYRLSLLDAMKIKSAVIVQKIIDSPEEICYHLYDNLIEFPFTYISVSIDGIGSYELTKEGK